MKDPFNLVIAVTTGIAFDQRTRRQTMFALTLAALVMLFVGTTVLSGAFAARRLYFAIYWLVCAWLTISTMLLSIYDLLVIVRRHRAERRRTVDGLKK